MTREEGIAWLRQFAAEVEAESPPRTDPHEWTGAQAMAAAALELADRCEEAGRVAA